MDSKARKKLDALYSRLSILEKTFLGYPCDAEFDYADLYRFLEFPLNNVGDPFESSTYRLETKSFEREVVAFFAKLYGVKDYWGYITNGGTEGNLYGLYLAREQLPNATLFFSEHTHYSIKKNAHILRMPYCIIRSQSNGEIDYIDLEKKSKGKKSVIIVANIGSTMTGAIDDVARIRKVLKNNKVEHYIHADAALYGMVLPFAGVKLDFSQGFQSISVSGHKFIGSPIPCGIVLCKKGAMKSLQSYIEYIDAHDSTISGSRDAFTPLIFWYRIKTIGIVGFKKQVRYSIGLADYLASELARIGWPDVQQSYLTVSFRRPGDSIVKRWELAANGNRAHVICLPHETKEQLSGFVKELARSHTSS